MKIVPKVGKKRTASAAFLVFLIIRGTVVETESRPREQAFCAGCPAFPSFFHKMVGQDDDASHASHARRRLTLSLVLSGACWRSRTFDRPVAGVDWTSGGWQCDSMQLVFFFFLYRSASAKIWQKQQGNATRPGKAKWHEHRPLGSGG